MRNEPKFYFIYIIAIFLLLNAQCNGVEKKMLNEPELFTNIKLDNVTKIEIESLAIQDFQKADRIIIEDTKTINNIIKEFENCELVDMNRYGLALSHNRIFTFYTNGIQLVRLEFFFHKNEPDLVLFRHRFYSTKFEQGMMREYHAKNKKTLLPITAFAKLKTKHRCQAYTFDKKVLVNRDVN